MLTQEKFRPIQHTPPNNFFNWIKFQIRLILDFQVNTVYRHSKVFFPKLTGKVLDVGCGQSPYKHLLKQSETEYYGVEIYNVGVFGGDNPGAIYFDGCHLPFLDNSVDHIICTEVIEHIEEPKKLINEMHRSLKLGGSMMSTVPWSARYHYIPYDYHRFTPAMLSILFKSFSSVDVVPRGTDVTVIIYKIIIVWVRGLQPSLRISWLLTALLSLLALPLIIVCLLVGHLTLVFNLGSQDDPLGYTVWLRK